MLEIQKYNKIIVANWKLNGSSSFIESYINNIKLKYNHDNSKCLVICPPNLFINKVKSGNFLIGAQDCSIYTKGAYTGEISTKMLRDIGCQFCIIGHSERRSLFNDNNDQISKKIINCLLEEIIPILCIGENFQQRKENLTKDILRDQIKKCLPKEVNYNNIIIAYEPLWAIGSGFLPSLEDISEILLFIKNDIFQNNNYKILYGGSIIASNSSNILNLKSLDGILVGGASINIGEFNEIINTNIFLD